MVVFPRRSKCYLTLFEKHGSSVQMLWLKVDFARIGSLRARMAVWFIGLQIEGQAQVVLTWRLISLSQPRLHLSSGSLMETGILKKLGILIIQCIYRALKLL